MIKAFLETPNFYFEAYGATKEQAGKALVKGLEAHGEQCRLPTLWYKGFLDDVQLEHIGVGYCYRDKEIIMSPHYVLSVDGEVRDIYYE